MHVCTSRQHRINPTHHYSESTTNSHQVSSQKDAGGVGQRSVTYGVEDMAQFDFGSPQQLPIGYYWWPAYPYPHSSQWLQQPLDAAVADSDPPIGDQRETDSTKPDLAIWKIAALIVIDHTLRRRQYREQSQSMKWKCKANRHDRVAVCF